MKFVQKNAPSVHVPETYYSWVDQEWQRSFVLMHRAPGQSLDDAWEKLTERQQRKIALELAAHVEILAQFTSTRLESVDGQGLGDSHLILSTRDTMNLCRGGYRSSIRHTRPSS